MTETMSAVVRVTETDDDGFVVDLGFRGEWTRLVAETDESESDVVAQGVADALRVIGVEVTELSPWMDAAKHTD